MSRPILATSTQSIKRSVGPRSNRALFKGSIEELVRIEFAKFIVDSEKMSHDPTVVSIGVPCTDLEFAGACISGIF